MNSEIYGEVRNYVRLVLECFEIDVGLLTIIGLLTIQDYQQDYQH